MDDLALTPQKHSIARARGHHNGDEKNLNGTGRMRHSHP